MADEWLLQLLWGILIAVIEFLAVGYGYLYRKDRDKRKLMFALAFTLSGIAYVRYAQPMWASVEVVKRLFGWGFLPLASAVFIAVFCSLLRLKNFNKPFKAFLFILTISILMMFVPLPVTPEPLLWFEAIGSVIVSVYLVLVRKQIPELMFVLSLGCNILAGVGMAQGLAPEFNILGSFMGYVFIALVLAIPNKIAEGSVGSFFALQRELKNTQEELRESEEKYRTQFEAALDAIFIAEAKTGIIIDCNRAASELMGREKSELVGKHQRILHPPEESKGNFSRTFKQHLKEKKGKILEAKVITKTGKIRDVAIKASIFKLRGQKLVQGVFRDVTESKLMENELRRYSEHLEELVEEKTSKLKETQKQLLKAERFAAIGELAAMVGHDLRNPLQSIKNATSCLKIELRSKRSKAIQVILKIIDESIEYSNGIIRDLLDYSRDMRLELAETTPKLIIRKALALIKVPENIQILDSTEDESKIQVDVDKIVRVFINIIKNAIEAMPQGGKLTIESKKSNGNLEITFADTGTGMSKDVMEKLWTPLHTTRAKGIGLGLPICKRIVDAHGGNINVNSTLGKGTTFTVRLPIKPRAEESKAIYLNEPEPISVNVNKNCTLGHQNSVS